MQSKNHDIRLHVKLLFHCHIMGNCDFVGNFSGLVISECNINSTEVTATLIMHRERDRICRLRFATCPRLHYAYFASVLPLQPKLRFFISISGGLSC